MNSEGPNYSFGLGVCVCETVGAPIFFVFVSFFLLIFGYSDMEMSHELLPLTRFNL